MGPRDLAVQMLDKDVKEAELYLTEEARAVRCTACGHRCLIKDGLRGICKVRFNDEGKLFVPWGYVAALNPDPIEKKPFYHFLPGSTCMTFGMLGCNFHCPFCQNWLSSQTIRDAKAITTRHHITAEAVVAAAIQNGAVSICSSYNEPLITTEWAVDIFREAKAQGLRTLFVSNGFASTEVLEYLHPILDGLKVDLKSMSRVNYRKLGGVLDRVLGTIKEAVGMGFWVEVVTLVVPGFNDSIEEIRDAARFLVSVSPDIPWHVTAYHRDYKMTGPIFTPAEAVIRAAEIGRNEGLNFVYAGNLPWDAAEPFLNTVCPDCNHILVRRRGYSILTCALTEDGTCQVCGRKIPGVW